MAKINICTYCGGSVLNHQWHPECRNAHCEGLLKQIQALSRDGNLKLPPDLETAIISDNFTSLDDLKQYRSDQIVRETDGRLREIARMVAAQNFLKNWEAEHPDPNAPTY